MASVQRVDATLYALSPVSRGSSITLVSQGLPATPSPRSLGLKRPQVAVVTTDSAQDYYTASKESPNGYSQSPL
jgi:hypothetical protein